MRLSIQRLRWVLLTGAVLLLAVLAGYIAYGRWRTMQTAIRIIQRAGVHITHDTNGFTYSQSVQGRTIFTLHAKTATQVGNGKWTLHDAEMTLYNRIPGRPDHVYGSEVEYDENDGVARAIGEVHMDLQAPEAFAENGHVKPQTAEDAAQHVIHVKTSGLVYLRKLGVAATDQLVDFNYNGMHCTAMGAEFNTGSNVLRLLKDVTMDGTTHEKPVHLTALDADIDRNDNFATLDHPVVRSEGRTGSSDSGLVNFEADGSIHRLQGSGDVVLSEGTRQITAAHLDARLNDDMELTEAHLSGGVGLIDTDPTRPMQGSASRVDAAFDAKGQPVSVTATGGAHVAVVDHRANPQGMGRGLGRSMEGTKIVALFKAGPHARGAKPQTQLTEVDAYGAARASGESVAAAAKGAGAGAAPGVRTMRVGADELRVSFAERADGAAQPKHMAGAGHTMLEQMAPMGEHETSTGDTLEMFFAAKTMDGAGGELGGAGGQRGDARSGGVERGGSGCDVEWDGAACGVRRGELAGDADGRCALDE
jgi:lipopolysaccharide export system protein LptA